MIFYGIVKRKVFELVFGTGGKGKINFPYFVVYQKMLKYLPTDPPLPRRTTNHFLEIAKNENHQLQQNGWKKMYKRKMQISVYSIGKTEMGNCWGIQMYSFPVFAFSFIGKLWMYNYSTKEPKKEKQRRNEETKNAKQEMLHCKIQFSRKEYINQCKQSLQKIMLINNIPLRFSLEWVASSVWSLNNNMYKIYTKFLVNIYFIKLLYK